MIFSAGVNRIFVTVSGQRAREPYISTQAGLQVKSLCSADSHPDSQWTSLGPLYQGWGTWVSDRSIVMKTCLSNWRVSCLGHENALLQSWLPVGLIRHLLCWMTQAQRRVGQWPEQSSPAVTANAARSGTVQLFSVVILVRQTYVSRLREDVEQMRMKMADHNSHGQNPPSMRGFQLCRRIERTTKAAETRTDGGR